MFWFVVKKPDIFNKTIFISMTRLFEYILKVSIENRPLSTYLLMGGERIVSLWAYPGTSKTPIDRIAELLEENEKLKRMVNQSVDQKGDKTT